MQAVVSLDGDLLMIRGQHSIGYFTPPKNKGSKKATTDRAKIFLSDFPTQPSIGENRVITLGQTPSKETARVANTIGPGVSATIQILREQILPQIEQKT